MPQAVKISSNVISGSISKNAISFNIEGQQRDFGTLDGGDWFSNVLPNDGRWVIISESKGSGIPAFWLTAGSSNSDLLTTVNGLPTRYNQADFTSTGSALDYLVQNKYMVLRSVPDNTDADNVVLYVDGGNESSFPRQGLPVYDLSGKVYDGALTNGTTWNSNGYWEFDGLDDYIDFGPVNNFGTDSFSVATWHYLATADAGIDYRNIVAKKDGTGANPGWTLRRQNNDNMYWFVADGASTRALSSTFTPPTNRWLFAAGTVDPANNEARLYINNVLDNSGGYSLGSVDAADNLRIGGWGASTDWMKGKISKVQLYNKALTQDDINQIYFGGPIVTDGLVFATDASNLVSYENGSTTTYSLTGSLSGTLVNGTGYLPNNGGTWNFDGGDDYITQGPSSELDTNIFSVEAFARLDTFDNNHRTIMARNASVYSHTNGWWFGTLRNGLGSGNNDLRFFMWGDSSYITFSSIGAADGKYHHVVITCDGTTGYFYIDGDLKYSSNKPSGNLYNSSAAMTTGRSPNGDYWAGDIPLTRFYNRALTQAEVLQNYNAQKQKYQL